MLVTLFSVTAEMPLFVANGKKGATIEIKALALKCCLLFRPQPPISLGYLGYLTKP